MGCGGHQHKKQKSPQQPGGLNTAKTRTLTAPPRLVNPLCETFHKLLMCMVLSGGKSFTFEPRAHTISANRKVFFMSSRVISFHYTLTDSAGEILDTSRNDNPFSFLEGVGQVIPGLEKHLGQMKVGEQKKLKLPAKEAYGERDEARVIEVPLEKLPKKDVKVGDMFLAGKEEEAPRLTVVGVTKTHAKLDANHPLAGKELHFDVEITGIRDATPDEIDHGHAHGAGCHH
jgi:FKBP-type peptidyl-prolyl cis-trans isomerase SlyD